MRRKANDSPAPRRLPPATTPEARENQMIAMAFDAAENQLRNGTASSQVITHFLKLGTIRAQVELEGMRQQNSLVQAKTEKIHSEKKSEELFTEAIEAMRTYSGQSRRSEHYDD